ncbi:hypothetical protein WOLCODRAFT_143726 [Wolfiporia cocos MD-104 SS10]|uniref:Uncharacterized protein n=1 Tax=Wolfiporia cocos (strain MD-104) TaxID=742152 RepID=A0A2H3JIN1_WOLCO|nr:hypothetical protein WOLCODRAFT_143726 [Wolfiporia cocos MD-104 SS10]
MPYSAMQLSSVVVQDIITLQAAEIGRLRTELSDVKRENLRLLQDNCGCISSSRLLGITREMCEIIAQVKQEENGSLQMQLDAAKEELKKTREELKDVIQKEKDTRIEYEKAALEKSKTRAVIERQIEQLSKELTEAKSIGQSELVISNRNLRNAEALREFERQTLRECVEQCERSKMDEIATLLDELSLIREELASCQRVPSSERDQSSHSTKHINTSDVSHCDGEKVINDEAIQDAQTARQISTVNVEGKHILCTLSSSVLSSREVNQISHQIQSLNIWKIPIGTILWTSSLDFAHAYSGNQRLSNSGRWLDTKLHQQLTQATLGSHVEAAIQTPNGLYYAGTYELQAHETLRIQAYKDLDQTTCEAIYAACATSSTRKPASATKRALVKQAYLAGIVYVTRFSLRRIGYNEVLGKRWSRQ